MNWKKLSYLNIKKIKKLQDKKIKEFIRCQIWPYHPYYKRLFKKNSTNPYSIKSTEKAICERFTAITSQLPKEIVFIHTDDLAEKYPDLPPRKREDEIAREYGAVFIIGIAAHG